MSTEEDIFVNPSSNAYNIFWAFNEHYFFTVHC